jgi:hypothetical protein
VHFSLRCSLFCFSAGLQAAGCRRPKIAVAVSQCQCSSVAVL